MSSKTTSSDTSGHELPFRGINPKLAQAYQETTKSFLASARTSARSEGVFSVPPGENLANAGMLVGVGLGVADESNTGLPGEHSLRLYTLEPITSDNARSLTIGAFGVDILNDERVPVSTICTGPIDTLAHRFKMDQAAPGVSIGHKDITAGTFGALVRGRSGKRAKRTLILSNNHVLANVNSGQLGDPILQPGSYDGGRLDIDQIGELERFVPISFDEPNMVDAATAMVDPEGVREQFIYLRGVNVRYFPVSKRLAPRKTGMLVGKTGRTTQLTSGIIKALGVNISVNMGGGKVAQFVNQIEISGTMGQFSRGGDSGALIWSWKKERRPVGLLFAGGNGVTFANPIEEVLERLDVDFI